MFKTVRSRLFVSHVLIIAFTLGTIGLLLSLVLLPRVRDQLIFSSLQLAFHPTALHLRAETLRALREQGRDQLFSTLRQTVTDVSERRGIRVLVLTGQYRVLADSEETLEGLSFAQVKPPSSRQQGDLAQGKYRSPDGQEFLWVGGPLELLSRQGQEAPQRPRFFLVPAQLPRDNARLSKHLRNQFLVAGGVGLALSLLLAFLIARSIARPLQRVAAAAGEVARGNYDLHLDIASPAEVRSVANSFNTMTQAVKASRQAQRDFMANVSHELKTPLTSIQGFSQALLDGTARDEAAKACAPKGGPGVAGSPDRRRALREPLVVPVGTKIRFVITAGDVIHSWWVPALPGLHARII